ncbi:MAG TPA: TlpA family protein disulfide reductase [Gemmataceae bacterium]|nr:TlpA family protein disulfide reductase [Gemmataceae bacterium]
MRSLRTTVLIGVVALLLGQGARPTSGQQLPDPVSVKVVDYKGLCDLVESNKGKVVLLDFWATWCIPCRKSFFQNAEFQKAFGDKGLVVISVSTFEFSKAKDDAEKKAKEKAVLDYLKSQNATYTNVILDVPDDLVKEKMRIGEIPCIYVFNPQGKWVQFIGDKLVHDKDNRHPEVEAYVKSLVDQLVAKKK